MHLPGFTRRQWLAAGLALPWTAHAAVDLDATPVLQPRPLRFPRDHGTHNATRTEWWYLTGHAQDAAGRPFGFQVTFFRSRVDAAQSLPGRLAARQLLFAHAAITDVQGGQLHHDQRIARWNGQPPVQREGGVWASEQDLHVVLRDWFLQRLPDGGYATRVHGEGLTIELRARADQAILLQGEAGFSRKGPQPAQSSFYVSHPQLAVQGRLRLGRQSYTVSGRAWLDHEWSQTLLHPDAVGWDWIGMNLDDGSSLTAFRLRRADGSALWAGGSWREASDAQRTGTVHFGPDTVVFEPRRFWTSPLTRARYPVEWSVQTPAGRHTVRAVIDPQELDSRQSTGTVYWEGLSDLLGAQGQRVGRGYLEMTGYAQRLVL
jgi:predicted secreted hydrolase